MQYTYYQLQEIAHAVRNLWASCYQGTMLNGMTKPIGTTGNKAYAGLLSNDVIQMFGGEGTSLPLQAIIAMGQDGMEEALRIQNGYAPFDMKPGFLNSKHAKTYKNGANAGKKYFIMGFRHMTPGSTERQGQVMNLGDFQRAKSGDKFVEQMGTEQRPGEGAKLKSKAVIDLKAMKFGSPHTMEESYQWRNGIYAGMTRAKQENEGKKHSGYRTFRVITPNTPQSAWWHPGQDPNDVVSAVVNHSAPFIKMGLEQAVRADVVDMINQAFNR